MYIVFTASIISIVLAYFSAYGRFDRINLFKLSFVPITVLQMIHYNYGTDYMTYLNDHLEYYGRSWQDFLYFYSVQSGAFKDMGWAILGHLFPGKVGFFIIVALISVLQNAIYYILIRDYVNPKHRWIAMSIYLFSTSYYVLSFSALRQGVVVAIGIFAIITSSKGKTIKAVILLLLGATIHGSIIVLIPFLFLCKLDIKKGKLIGYVMLLVGFILFLGAPIVNTLYSTVMKYVPFLERRYGYYATSMSAIDSSLGLGFLLNLLMYLVFLYFIIVRFEEFSKEHRLFLILTEIPLFVIPFSQIVSGGIGRIGTYFEVFEIVMVPEVYSKIKDKYLRLGVSFVYVFMMLYTYYDFFFVTEWSSNSYRDFHTIFSLL